MPSLLVFGVIPTFPITNKRLPNQTELIQAIAQAGLEMETIVSEQRIERALRSKLPPAVRYKIDPGDEVLVYREEPRKWLGPYKVQRIDGKRVFVNDGTTTRPFNMTHVLPAKAERGDLKMKRLLEGLNELQSTLQKSCIRVTNVLRDRSAMKPKRRRQRVFLNEESLKSSRSPAYLQGRM